MTLICMNNLRRRSLGLMARNPDTPSAKPNAAGIKAVRCTLPVPRKPPRPKATSRTANTSVTFAKHHILPEHSEDTSCMDASVATKDAKIDGFNCEVDPVQRCIRADPPFANARTCSRVAMVVSPGNVVNNAPCAHPSLIASSGDSPLMSP